MRKFTGYLSWRSRLKLRARTLGVTPFPRPHLSLTWGNIKMAG